MACVSPADSRVFSDKNATVSSPESLFGGKLFASGAGFKREELSFSHRVAEHVIAPFFLPGTAAPLTFPTPLLLKVSFKQNPQTFPHSERFVAK